MKRIMVIGIGAGNPEYLTIQAINALNQVDVFFILDKGSDKEKLIEFRRDVCRRYVTKEDYRFLDANSPEWDRASSAYHTTIADLNSDKQAVFDRLIGQGIEDGECGAFLVWGDPTLYDSTLRILDDIAATGVHDFDYEVFPGISAPQALVAQHKTTLNQIGGGVQITTGRRISEGLPEGVDSLIVMLDAHCVFSKYTDEDIDIYWGAYIGTPDEILVAGKLKDVSEEIIRVRAEARREHGWIMDTYLLRRNLRKDG